MLYAKSGKHSKIKHLRRKHRKDSLNKENACGEKDVKKYRLQRNMLKRRLPCGETDRTFSC